MNFDGSHPDLSALVLGTLPNAEAVYAGLHLERCEECRTELVDLVPGHAALLRASRTLGETTPAPPAEEALPALDLPPRSRKRLLAGLVAAAAVTTIAGIGALTLVDDEPSTPPETAPTADVHPLEPLDQPGAVPGVRGSVQLQTIEEGVTRVRVRTDDLPATDAGEFYEVWLLDPATNKMLALGPIGAPDATTFELPQRLLDRYRAVDISLERDDGNPAHSLTSVLRGTYT